MSNTNGDTYIENNITFDVIFETPPVPEILVTHRKEFVLSVGNIIRVKYDEWNIIWTLEVLKNDVLDHGSESHEYLVLNVEGDTIPDRAYSRGRVKMIYDMFIKKRILEEVKTRRGWV